ncbi:hypothetical protein ANN_21678, partial [Periplaneta americana]
FFVLQMVQTSHPVWGNRSCLRFGIYSDTLDEDATGGVRARDRRLRVGIVAGMLLVTTLLIVSIVKMATPQVKAQTVLWCVEFKSIVRVQREYRRVFNHDAPTAKSIKKWHDTFLATGSVLKKHGGGRRTSDEMVANVQAAYERSPRKSLRRASRELQVPESTLQRIVHKRLKLYAVFFHKLNTCSLTSFSNKMALLILVQ